MKLYQIIAIWPDGTEYHWISLFQTYSEAHEIVVRLRAEIAADVAAGKWYLNRRMHILRLKIFPEV